MAFKMKGSPMQRNFGIGTPAKKATGKPEGMTTEEWNAQYAEEKGTTATKTGEGKFTSDVSYTEEQMQAEKEAKFRENLKSKNPDMTPGEINQAVEDHFSK